MVLDILQRVTSPGVSRSERETLSSTLPVPILVHAEVAGHLLPTGSPQTVNHGAPCGPQRPHEEIGVCGHEEVHKCVCAAGFPAKAVLVVPHPRFAILPPDVRVVECPPFVILGLFDHALQTQSKADTLVCNNHDNRT